MATLLSNAILSLKTSMSGGNEYINSSRNFVFGYIDSKIDNFPVLCCDDSAISLRSSTEIAEIRAIPQIDSHRDNTWITSCTSGKLGRTFCTPPCC